jgi:serine/threonine protein kinase
VTHKDLKPENLLIGGEDPIKTCDFGSSQRYGHTDDISAFYIVTGEFSTVWYRELELLLGGKTFKNKIDVRVIGCIMMEMLSGAVNILYGIKY